MNTNNHRFKKKFGQNFLKDKTICSRIVSSANLSSADLVIEIGPGSGMLTKELVKYAQVLAYEIDADLMGILEEEVNSENLAVIWDDFLKRNTQKDIKNYKYDKLHIISNLPYYITTPIITKIINDKINIEQIIVMVQKEVADRFSAKPGDKKYGSITVFLNYYFDIKKLFDVSRNLFFPVPNVDSAVILLKSKKRDIIVNNEDIFFKLIKDSFQYKRKTLRNNLKNYDLIKVEETLKKHDFDLSVRAEDIPLEVFIEISNNLDV